MTSEHRGQESARFGMYSTYPSVYYGIDCGWTNYVDQGTVVQDRT